jgi:hypothetical protein
LFVQNPNGVILNVNVKFFIGAGFHWGLERDLV